MEELYYLWSTKHQGWMGLGPYTTELAQAKTMPRSEAIALARRQFDDNMFGLIPVAQSDAEEIRR